MRAGRVSNSLSRPGSPPQASSYESRCADTGHVVSAASGVKLRGRRPSGSPCATCLPPRAVRADLWGLAASLRVGHRRPGRLGRGGRAERLPRPAQFRVKLVELLAVSRSAMIRHDRPNCTTSSERERHRPRIVLHASERRARVTRAGSHAHCCLSPPHEVKASAVSRRARPQAAPRRVRVHAWRKVSPEPLHAVARIASQGAPWRASALAQLSPGRYRREGVTRSGLTTTQGGRLLVIELRRTRSKSAAYGRFPQ